ncbi:FolC bifunctional protein [Rubrobacter xylanophilus DSM 9941]|uniref:tetrahydrofolate synthase n=1 Tax=Rubrobacter xylanophilus (strain DSM 9941 / JCM 11954 / NBRC 16129 / PRD-1) TaxID=266117 RepID=Q1AVT2_RUBXD|nr:cyanophycin synthetase [Rubrobacter xylanophilus]ABG04496.1 FolC bifunctional protein [Rubrobacter xylanophilus DSM 9941]
MDRGTLPARRFSFREVAGELDRRKRMTLGLERVEALLEALGHPEERLRVVQVVGTNGKGTTAAALALALEELGEPAGLYLSPHVLSYAERVALRGRRVTEEEFAAGMGRAIAAADARGIPASQFELLTAGALSMFREAGVAWAVLEAGLGARHDATTAARPEAVVLTNVGRDHVEILGETTEARAREKLGGLRRGATLFLGTSAPEVVRVAREEAARRGARLVGPLEEPGEPGSWGMAPYAARNAALGMRVAGELLGGEVPDAGRVARRVPGLLPGRFEVHRLGGVPVVVDGGHNPEGIEAALRAMRSAYGGRPLAVVFGVLRDKDIGSMLVPVRREAGLLVLARPGEERAADPDWVRREFGLREARVVPEVGEAVELAAGEMSGRGGVVLVTGSLYTCAAALGRLREG